ncbi:unnamed protein product, partial [Tetraodon nigroviridis]
SAASLLASVREQERQFEMLSRALEEERRSCAGTLPRPLPNMQVMRKRPRGRRFLSSSCTCSVESLQPCCLWSPSSSHPLGPAVGVRGG